MWLTILIKRLSAIINTKIAIIGEKSIPKTTGIKRLKIFKYGATMLSIHRPKRELAARGNQLNAAKITIANIYKLINQLIVCETTYKNINIPL